MKMKFIYVLLGALLLGSQMSLSAQNNDNREKKQRPTQEQMVQMQTNQMVKTLMLDDATAAKFTPVYEKYLNELRECRMMNRKPRAEKAQGAEANAKREGQRPSMTDAEIAAMLKNQFAQSPVESVSPDVSLIRKPISRYRLLRSGFWLYRIAPYW